MLVVQFTQGLFSQCRKEGNVKLLLPPPPYEKKKAKIVTPQKNFFLSDFCSNFASQYNLNLFPTHFGKTKQQ